MSFHPLKSFLSLAVLSLFILGPALGCESGKQKRQTQNVEKDGLEKCAVMEAELRDLGIELNGRSPGQFKEEATLNPDMQPTTLPLIQEKLEDYLQLANRLLDLAEGRLVVFSERHKLSVRVERASKFLGQVYARTLADPLRENTMRSYAVELAEFEVRFNRVSLDILWMDAHNIRFGKDIDQDNLNKQDVPTLREIKEIANRLFYDLARVKKLMERNHDFNLKELHSYNESGNIFAGYFIGIQMGVDKALILKKAPINI